MSRVTISLPCSVPMQTTTGQRSWRPYRGRPVQYLVVLLPLLCGDIWVYAIAQAASNEALMPWRLLTARPQHRYRSSPQRTVSSQLGPWESGGRNSFHPILHPENESNITLSTCFYFTLRMLGEKL
ncbi:hypothetical protein KR074_002278 [Drosophila pseudoananassae]|nr:hypothetical protein KR074_002278 [Drosophila pseudoananassae]